jgi:hypothetical protein
VHKVHLELVEQVEPHMIARCDRSMGFLVAAFELEVLAKINTSYNIHFEEINYDLLDCDTIQCRQTI